MNPIAAAGEPGSSADTKHSGAMLRRMVEHSRLVCLIGTFATLAYYVWLNPFRIGWDAANYVQAAQEILRGRVPFVDIVDVNPPLVQFLHVPPALLARLLDWPAPFVFNAYVLIAAIASVALLDWLLRRPGLELSTERRFLTIIAFALGNHIAWVGGHFGQREHFFVLALVPAAVVRWLRYENHAVPRSIALILGVAAATALAVKPHYLLPMLWLEIVLFLRHRDLRRLPGFELWGLVVVGVAYAGLFVAYPDMRREFLGRYLPLFATGYAAYSCSLRDLLRPTELWVGILGATLALTRPGTSADSRFARPFGAFVAGCVMAYLVQHRGWLYQALPAFFLTPMALAQVLPAWRILPIPLVIGVLANATAWNQINAGRPFEEERNYTVLRRAVTTLTRPGEPVLILTTHVLAAYPMQLQLDVRPGSRYAWLPLLAMFYPGGKEYGCKYRKWGEGLPAERQLLEDLAFDIRERKPVLIAAEAQETQAMRLGCNPRQWLRESGLLERAMSDYVELPPASGFEIWGLRSRPLPGWSPPQPILENSSAVRP